MPNLDAKELFHLIHLLVILLYQMRRTMIFLRLLISILVAPKGMITRLSARKTSIF